MLNSKAKIKKHFSTSKNPYASSAGWLWKFLRNKEKTVFYSLVKSLDKQTCLDMGAGSCEYSKMLLDMGAKYSVCVDFSSSLMLSKVGIPGIEKVSCDVELFETNKKCDLILCLGILEFLSNPEKFMLRLKSFLKPKGKIIVLLPLSKIASLIYAFFYLLKGICIHPLTMKKMSCFLISRGFLLEKTINASLFSGFAIYSICEK